MGGPISIPIECGAERGSLSTTSDGEREGRGGAGGGA